MNPTLFALGAIALWSTLATLGLALAHVPPFLLTGLSLLIGSLIALPLSRFDMRQWRVPLRTLALGVYGLFGFHFLLFMALRNAPPVEANLVNYLWPLLMVVLAAQVVLLNTAPQNAYYALTLQTWEQGRFIHFHGLAQWVGWVWPFVAFAYLIGRLGGGDGGQPPVPLRPAQGVALWAAPRVADAFDDERAMPARPTLANDGPAPAVPPPPPRIDA